MRWAPAVLLTLALFFSACNGTDGPQPTSSPTPSPISGDPDAPRAERPSWQLRQGWTYDVEIPGQPRDSFNMIVAEDKEELWVVASDERQKAVHHAVYSTNPVLGRISKQTLSPYQDGEPVSMYEFPLEDGKTWSAEFFGEAMQFRTTFEAIDLDRSLGLGPQVEGFRVEAKGSSGRLVAYDYVEGVEWFTGFEVRTPDDEREIKLTLVDLIEDYSGPYHFYRGADAVAAHRSHSANQLQSMESDSGTVPEDRSDRVAIGVVYEGRQGAPGPYAQITLFAPSGDQVWQREFSGATQITALHDVAGSAGEWRVEYVLRGNVGVDVRVVGFLNYSEGDL